MQNSHWSRLAASVRRKSRILSFGLIVGALASSGIVAPAQAAPSRKMSAHSRHVSATEANRIARNYVGGSAYVVRNEGIYDGAYRIHVHRGHVARHVFVGARTGRVVKTRLIKRAADLREDQPRR